jgi:hypothetical protein
VNAIALEPGSYACAEHKQDLTAQVRNALGDDSENIPTAYRRPGASPLPFRVIVTCPGAKETGSHDLVCTGTYTR